MQAETTRSRSVPSFLYSLCSNDLSYALCSSWTDPLNYCAGNAVQCDECGGCWCTVADTEGGPIVSATPSQQKTGILLLLITLHTL